MIKGHWQSAVVSWLWESAVWRVLVHLVIEHIKAVPQLPTFLVIPHFTFSYSSLHFLRCMTKMSHRIWNPDIACFKTVTSCFRAWDTSSGTSEQEIGSDISICSCQGKLWVSNCMNLTQNTLDEPNPLLVIQNHRNIESLRLEKTSKTTESNLWLNTTLPTKP